MRYRWLIDGVGAGLIMGPAIYRNGQYSVDFDRGDATLEQIEAINWAKPTIEYVGPHGSEPGLPEGYGFDVAKIEYLSNTKTYRVHLKVASQYLGDVTGYQAQITDLESAAAEKDSTISTQAAQLQEQSATIAGQAATIEEQASTIQTLQEAGTAAELEAGLNASYEEGVESVG